MMKLDVREDNQYCTSCGAVNKKSAVFCAECNKKINVRHRPVVDFLKKRVKGGVVGEVTEKGFDLVKNFLFDHLYGLVLTVSVVTTATVTFTTATPYIENVTTRSAQDTTATAVVDEYRELTEKDITRVYHVTMTYDAKIDNTMRPDNGFWGDDPDYTSPTEFWAENAIEGYTHKGRHDLYDKFLPRGWDILHRPLYDANWQEWESNGFYPKHWRYVPISSAKLGSDVTSELGHTLLAEGYDVMEVDYYNLTYDDKSLEDVEFNYKEPPPTSVAPYEKYVYRFLLTRKHGEEKWYIAEDVFVGQTGGPKYYN